MINDNNGLEFLDVAEAESISEVASKNPFEIVELVSALSEDDEIIKYILYASKFKENTIFCGLFHNPNLSDDHIGRLRGYFVSKIVIDCLVVSSPFASPKTIVEVLSSAFPITREAAAFRSILDDNIIEALLNNMSQEVRDILLMHPFLSESQKVSIALSPLAI